MSEAGGAHSLSIRGITKTYPGVIALRDVSIDFRRGEVHALVGENGAGKSTLMKVVSGATEPDSGTFAVNGVEYAQITPAQSQRAGIQIVHQELNMVPTLSVTENIFLGSYIGNGLTVDFAAMRRETEKLFEALGILNLDPDGIVEDLTIAQMQLVEIAKAIRRRADVLILDEPTSPLTMHETEILFDIIGSLKRQNVTIIYISHRMNEIYRIADRITILRDGQKIATADIGDISREELIRKMVGRTLTETYPNRHVPGDECVLKVDNLSGNGLQNISLSVRRGEILGLAGLVGAGRTELVRLIYGADPIEAGTISVDGRPVGIKSPAQAVSEGIGLLPEDRKRHGVILDLSIKENIILTSLKSISRFLTVNRRRERDIIRAQIGDLRIKAPSMDQLVRNLSGGNQQKVVVSKWLASSAKVLIFDEPTRGIDVGAKQEIYMLMNRLTEKGIGIIMVSSEMEELMGMADRIVVLREGAIAGEISSRDLFTQERIMELASPN